MKIPNLLLLFVLYLFVPLILIAQTKKINATYTYDIDEYLVIRETDFVLYGRLPFVPHDYGIDKGDSILSEGKVRYESDNFIELTSKDYEWEAIKNMSVTERIDSCLNDSMRFNFVFPFDGKYTLTLFIGRDIYDFTDKKKIMVPAYKDSIASFSFVILNQTPLGKFYQRNYLKTVKFHKPKITIQNKNSNSFDIFIPDLTNSYFNRFLINGEYIKVSKEKDVLFWHNRKYSLIYVSRD
jgi:hypothetical protein